MARDRTIYRCSACGAMEPKWAGRCSACGAWNELVEEHASPHRPVEADERTGPRVRPRPIAEVDTGRWHPAPTHVAELDRVLAGGLVPGSVTVLGGEPGIGKSTLLLQALAGLAKDGQPLPLRHAPRSRPSRCGCGPSGSGRCRPTCGWCRRRRCPRSSTTWPPSSPTCWRSTRSRRCYDPALASAPGSVAQVRECAHRLVRLAKDRGLATVLVGHVTKDGGLAGPRVLEHLVDTVLAFEGERHHALRLLRAAKHRFGSTDEPRAVRDDRCRARRRPRPVGPVPRRPAPRASPGPWSRRCSTGTGPLLVEVQALVTRHHLPTPRRSAQGLDGGRLALVLAVLGTPRPGPFTRARRPHGGGRRGERHRAGRRPGPGPRAAVGPHRACRCPTTSSPAERSGWAASCARCTRPRAAWPRRPAWASGGPWCRPALRRPCPGIEVLRAATLAEAVATGRCCRGPGATCSRPAHPEVVAQARRCTSTTTIRRWRPAAAPSSSPRSASWRRARRCGPASTASSRPRWAAWSWWATGPRC